MERLKVGLVGTYEDTFIRQSAEGVFEQSILGLRRLSAELGFVFEPWEKLVVTRADAIEARKQMETEGVDVVVVQCSSFAGGEFIQILAQGAYKLGLWALPETSCEGPLPVNSFCGMNMYNSIVSHYMRDAGIKCKWFYGNAEDELFVERFSVTARALAAMKAIHGSNIGFVGGIAPGFNDFYFDERSLQTIFGFRTCHYEISEFVKRAKSYTSDEVAQAVDTMSKGVSRISIPNMVSDRVARVYKAFVDIALEDNLSAMSISCWPAFQDDYEIHVCSVLGRLNESGLPAACEGDFPAAISMLLLKELSGRSPALMDLSNIDFSDDSILMWHCGPAPVSWADEAGVAHKTVSIGSCSSPIEGGVYDMVFFPGSVTMARLTGEGDRVFAFTGEIMEKTDGSFDGARGWVRNIRVDGKPVAVIDLVNSIMVQGMQHHYPLIRGDVFSELMEICAWLDIDSVGMTEYRPYLQVVRRS